MSGRIANANNLCSETAWKKIYGTGIERINIVAACSCQQDSLYLFTLELLHQQCCPRVDCRFGHLQFSHVFLRDYNILFCCSLGSPDQNKFPAIFPITQTRGLKLFVKIPSS